MSSFAHTRLYYTNVTGKVTSLRCCAAELVDGGFKRFQGADGRVLYVKGRTAYSVSQDALVKWSTRAMVDRPAVKAAEPPRPPSGARAPVQVDVSCDLLPGEADMLSFLRSFHQ